MKHTHFIQTKLNYLPKQARFVEIDNKSIDVDTVKVYEIKDQNAQKSTIDIDPLNSQTYSNEQKITESFINQINRPFNTSKATAKEKIISISQQQDGQNISIKNIKKCKPTPFESYMYKIQKITAHFLSINEANPDFRISSQHFYNISQSRKKLFQTNLASSKDFFQGNYTNYISFLQYLIQSRQRDYEIYGEFQQLQKILNILQNEIQDLSEIYLAEEQAKIYNMLSFEFTQEIQNIAKNCDLLHKKQQIIPVNEYFSQAIPIIEQNIKKSPVQEGQMNVQSLSNKSFHNQSREFSKNTFDLNKSLQKIEVKNQIEVQVEELKLQANSNKILQSERLFSSFEERQLYSHIENELIIESESNQQKCKTQFNQMDIEEGIQ